VAAPCGGALKAGAQEIARFNEALDQALAESVERSSAEISKARDMFLAVLGHDLRGPLTAVRMGADLLSKHELADSARLQDGLELRRAHPGRLAARHLRADASY